jgi:hypothetical protein
MSISDEGFMVFMQDKYGDLGTMNEKPIKDKPVVHYIPSKYDHMVVGYRGEVYPVDHSSVWVDNGRVKPSSAKI